MRDGSDASRPERRPDPDDELADLSRRIAWAVHRACPQWLFQERDDLIQAAALRVLALSRRGEVVGRPPTSYVLKVAHSVVMDEIRRRDRHRPPSLSGKGLDSAAEAGTGLSSPPGQESRELGRAVLACLARLVASRRRAVTLYLLGHTVPEAAERLALDTKQANNLVYRGLADLRRCLTEKGYAP